MATRDLLRQKINALVANGIDRSAAVVRVFRENPALHQALMNEKCVDARIAELEQDLTAKEERVATLQASTAKDSFRSKVDELISTGCQRALAVKKVCEKH